MARLSATALRYGLHRDLAIYNKDIAKERNLTLSSVCLHMQGRGGNKKKDEMQRKKIYSYYKSKSQNPVSFEMFWGIDKEFYEVN